MAERTVTITYKKSRINKRAFKFWDTAYMYEAMQDAVDVKAQLEKVLEAGVAQEDSMVAVRLEQLYKLADAYIDGYSKLLNEELIKTANISKIQPLLN